MCLNQRVCISIRGMHHGVFRENWYYHTANWENLPSYRSASSQEAKFSHRKTSEELRGGEISLKYHKENVISLPPSLPIVENLLKQRI